MARYSNKRDNDLYDEVSYLFRESNMTLTDFVALLLRLISDLIANETP